MGDFEVAGLQGEGEAETIHKTVAMKGLKEWCPMEESLVTGPCRAKNSLRLGP